ARRRSSLLRHSRGVHVPQSARRGGLRNVLLPGPAKIAGGVGAGAGLRGTPAATDWRRPAAGQPADPHAKVRAVAAHAKCDSDQLRRTRRPQWGRDADRTVEDDLVAAIEAARPRFSGVLRRRSLQRTDEYL